MDNFSAALVGLLAAIVGGVLAGMFSLFNEHKKAKRDRKYAVYAQFLFALSGLSKRVAGSSEPYDFPRLFLESRMSVALHGSSVVVTKLGKLCEFERLEGEALKALDDLIVEMRRDVGQKHSVQVSAHVRNILLSDVGKKK